MRSRNTEALGAKRSVNPARIASVPLIVAGLSQNGSTRDEKREPV
jgi:hypothetical protein